MSAKIRTENFLYLGLTLTYGIKDLEELDQALKSFTTHDTRSSDGFHIAQALIE